MAKIPFNFSIDRNVNFMMKCQHRWSDWLERKISSSAKSKMCGFLLQSQGGEKQINGWWRCEEECLDIIFIQTLIFEVSDELLECLNIIFLQTLNPLRVGGWGLGLELRVGGWGLRLEAWGLRVEGLELRVVSWRLRLEGWRLMVEGLKLRVEGLKLRVEAWVLRVWGWGL